MTAMGPWGAGELAALFGMWAVMMAAMMVPSATPILALVGGVARRRRENGGPIVSSGIFLSGYLAVWTVFSAAAALGQWGLHRAALMSPAMETRHPQLAGALLLIAGLYQWLPLKELCLTHCRSPLGWLSAEWREGPRGAFVMGARHGTFCLGCCWALMTVLFVVGVMNLLWIVGLAALVLVEKVVPQGRVIGKAAGIALIVWGVVLVV